ncbi:MAG: cupin domain-containing protein [Candidatus Taylorbacteria bacterium]|nr:cupin domain-containing protein [Candidatus Taylorbacteria bacterium]
MQKLIQAKWANFIKGQLMSFEGAQPLQMQHSDGTALPLVLDDSTPKKFGAEVVVFQADKGVGLHTHVGAHILLVTKGEGVLIYESRHGLDGPALERHVMFPGMIYLVPSNVPHAIKATTELVLIAIGNDHKPADSLERLEIVEKRGGKR